MNHHEAADSMAQWAVDQQPQPAEAVTHYCHPEDVDMSHVFPLEPFFRKHPTAPFWFIVAVCLVGFWMDALA